MRLPQRMKWMEWAFFPATAVYYSLCAWFDIQLVQKRRAGRSPFSSGTGHSHSGGHFWPGVVVGVWRVKCVSERVCIFTVLNINMMWVGVDETTDSRKSARPGFQGQRKPCFSYEGVGKVTFWDHSHLGVQTLGKGHDFFLNSVSSQSRSLRESKLWQLPAYRAFGDLPGRLVCEEEPGHASSRWDFLGADVMRFIPPFEPGLGSLQRALTSTLWDWTPSRSPGHCGAPTLVLG